MTHTLPPADVDLVSLPRKMHSMMAINDTSTVKALNQNDSFTPSTRMVVRMTTVASAMGSMTIAAALLSHV
jgi:hypothetical protein